MENDTNNANSNDSVRPSYGQLLRQLERNHKMILSIFQQQKQQQQNNNDMTAEINGILYDNALILGYDDDDDQQRKPAARQLETMSASSNKSSPIDTEVAPTTTATATTTTTTITKRPPRKTLIDKFGQDVWADRILPMVSNFLSPESYSYNILNFEDFYNNVPKELQHMIDQMIDDRTFIKPWKLGHLFYSVDHFTFCGWVDGYPHDRNKIIQYCINCSYNKVALGDTTAGNIYLIDRNDNNSIVPLHDHIGYELWEKGDDGSHCFCFDKQHPGVFVACTSDGNPLGYGDDAHLMLIVYTDVQSIIHPFSTGDFNESDRVNPDYVIRNMINYRNAEDWCIRDICSMTLGSPHGRDTIPSLADNRPDNGKIISVRLYADGDEAEQSDIHAVFDVTVNLSDGSYKETLVMEFLEEELEYEAGGHTYYNFISQRLSENGRYFSMIGKGRSNKRHVILICDLEENRNHGQTGVSWLCSKVLKGNGYNTSVEIIGDKAFISLHREKTKTNNDDKNKIPIIWDFLNDKYLSLLHSKDDRFYPRRRNRPPPGSPITGRTVACQCLSPDGKLLAIAWADGTDGANNNHRVELFDSETLKKLGSSHEADEDEEEITGLFFATSTGDTLCAIRTTHAYMYSVNVHVGK